jgi:poly(A) polymerase
MIDQLPFAPWTQRQDLAALVSALGADNVRWVGGAVRDTLLGVDAQDIDAATPLRPEEVIERLQAAGIRTIPTGIAHGTVTALLDGGNVEITTLRHDVSTDGRRATVAFAQAWHEDAARRDFTINALFAHPQTLEISDYFGGLDDLAAKRVFCAISAFKPASVPTLMRKQRKPAPNWRAR